MADGGKHKLAGTYANSIPTRTLFPARYPQSAVGRLTGDLALNHRPYYRYTTADWTSPLASRLLVSHVCLMVCHGEFFRVAIRCRINVIGVDDTVTVSSPQLIQAATDTWMKAEMEDECRMSPAPTNSGRVSSSHARNDKIQWVERRAVSVRQRRADPLNLSAAPTASAQDRDAELGLYGGDKWTMGRLTLSGAARFDYLKSSFPDVLQPPGTLFPSRTTFVVPGGASASWKDLTWRMAAVHNLFGDGRTAVRVSLNKYVESSGNGGGLSNPNAFVATAFKSWNDFTFPVGDPRRGDYVPDGCDLLATPRAGMRRVVESPFR